MIIPDKTIVVQFVNFIVTLIVLNLVLIKPLRTKIKERKELVAGMMTEVETFNAQAEEKLKSYEKSLAEARKAGADERVKMKEAGEAQEHEIVEQAQAKAQAQFKAAREKIEADAKAALDELKSKVDAMAKKAADKVLG